MYFCFLTNSFPLSGGSDYFTWIQSSYAWSQKGIFVTNHLKTFCNTTEIYVSSYYFQWSSLIWSTYMIGQNFPVKRIYIYFHLTMWKQQIYTLLARGKCNFHSAFKMKSDSKETLNHSLEGEDCSDLKASIKRLSLSFQPCWHPWSVVLCVGGMDFFINNSTQNL